MASREQGRRRQRRYLRFAWSHESAAHRALVRVYYAFMRRVPFSWKYGWGALRRRHKAPYSLLGPGSVAVQVGAPSDTLHAGRSRGMYFAMLAGMSVVIEPEPASAAEFERVARDRGIRGVSVVNAAAWSEPSKVRLRVDPAHPASSFTEGAASHTQGEFERTVAVEVPGRTIDEILTDLSLSSVDVLSVTTNGGELEILRGARELFDRGVSYVCLRHGCEEGERYLIDQGYEFYSHDDRGATFNSPRVKLAP